MGSILMAMTLPLYAGIFNPGRTTLDNLPARLHLQIANSLITGTDDFSILDTRRQLKPVPGGSGGVNDLSRPTPAFNMSNRVVPVPEPANYVLMGLGVVGLFLARRDRLSAK